MVRGLEAVSDEPSLLEAFRTFGPLGGFPGENERRVAAAKVLLRELQSIAKRPFGKPANRDDAVSQVLESMLRAGPRGVKPDDPQSDENIRVWLRVAWIRKVTGLERGGVRFVDLEQVLSILADPQPGVDVVVDLARLRNEIEAARQQLFGEIVSSLANRGQLDARVVDDLRSVAEQHATVNDLVEREEPGLAKGTPEWRRVRNRIDQRNRRAIKCLIAEIARLDEAENIGWMRFRALGLVVAELQVQQKAERAAKRKS
jgi:hypothetical protein